MAVLRAFRTQSFHPPGIMTSLALAVTAKQKGSEVFGNGWTRIGQGKWAVFAEKTHGSVAYLGTDEWLTASTSKSLQPVSQNTKIPKDTKDSIDPVGLHSSEISRISRFSKDSQDAISRRSKDSKITKISKITPDSTGASDLQSPTSPGTSRCSKDSAPANGDGQQTVP